MVRYLESPKVRYRRFHMSVRARLLAPILLSGELTASRHPGCAREAAERDCDPLPAYSGFVARSSELRRRGRRFDVSGILLEVGLEWESQWLT